MPIDIITSRTGGLKSGFTNYQPGDANSITDIAKYLNWVEHTYAGKIKDKRFVLIADLGESKNRLNLTHAFSVTKVRVGKKQVWTAFDTATPRGENIKVLKSQIKTAFLWAWEKGMDVDNHDIILNSGMSHRIAFYSTR